MAIKGFEDLREKPIRASALMRVKAVEILRSSVLLIASQMYESKEMSQLTFCGHGKSDNMGDLWQQACRVGLDVEVYKMHC